VFYECQNFGYELHMLAFGLGATMFYALFLQSRVIPRALAILGIVAAPLALVGTLLLLLGLDVPLAMFIANLPFELCIGAWLVIRGFGEHTAKS